MKSHNIIVIFGVTGDLAKRKLFPALNALDNRDELPSDTVVIGCGRGEKKKNIFETLDKKLRENSTYLRVQISNMNHFLKLKEKICSIKKSDKSILNITFYLSTPPSSYKDIISNIIKSDLNKENSGYSRIVIEKPFGQNLETAKKLNKLLKSGFNESQIYRIDHYLGKETVQNILVSRYSNLIFNALWSKDYISYVEITAAESIGIGSRGGYYDKSGALKDMFQNHLLELLCLIAMEDPKENNPESIRDEKIKVLKSIRDINFDQHIVRGQYVESRGRNGEEYDSYRSSEGVENNSKTETFLACKLFLDNKRWKDIPFFIRTGKRMPTKVTEIVVNFKKNKNIFSSIDESNMLIFRLQPDEGLLVKFNLKKPGKKKEIINKNLEFHYKNLSNKFNINSYETLIMDVFNGDTLLFSRSDFVEMAWKIVDPISSAIKRNKLKLFSYKSGTWGPKNANDVFRNHNTWRYPCKNLVNDGEECEL
tara:strand:- start:112 stop:1554 length:1443 start_codon:yes stop_codon:yes gene_type:complete